MTTMHLLRLGERQLLSFLPPDAGPNDDGFTLIELLVVMIIIGILAAIAIPVFLNQQKKGYDASVKSDLRAVAVELQTYDTDNQTFAIGLGTAANTAYAANTTITGGTTTDYVGPDAVHLSNGTTVTLVIAGSNGFCLAGTNTGDSGVFYAYDSLQGGLQTSRYTSAATACASTTGY